LTAREEKSWREEATRAACALGHILSKVLSIVTNVRRRRKTFILGPEHVVKSSRYSSSRYSIVQPISDEMRLSLVQPISDEMRLSFFLSQNSEFSFPFSTFSPCSTGVARTPILYCSRRKRCPCNPRTTGIESGKWKREF
jgi:hypothetical protein